MAEKLGIEVLESFPPVDEDEIDRLLAEEIAKNDMKFIVLDDDPTGVQTVHDIDVYTDWESESIADGLSGNRRIFYILTNSRGMNAKESEVIHKEIGRRAREASRKTGSDYLFMSRSDSTLRGHYPLESQLLAESLEEGGAGPDGEILCFFFKEGGRYTLGDIHYVKDGRDLVPAADTEFARDKSFGYTKSSIPEYIEEKTGGVFKAEDVVSISLEELRAVDIDGIQEKLEAVESFNKVCVNAIDYCDVKVFAVALYRALGKGKRFVFRTAAGLVKVMGGVSDKPLLTREEMIKDDSSKGGLVVIGSHTEKTTAQLKDLVENADDIVSIPFNSDLVLEGDEALSAEVDRCVAAEEGAIKAGKLAVVYTSRSLLMLDDDTRESVLMRSVKISESVKDLVARLRVKPSFIIAKGGITSSDVGTKGLGVRKAKVLGQICPGVPVWRTDEGSKFPGMPYVIFPGNVGTEETLREAVEKLRGREPESS